MVRHSIWFRGALALVLASGMPTAAYADSLSDGRDEALVLDDEWMTSLSQPTAIAFLPDGRAVVSERGGTLKLRALDGSVTVAGEVPADSDHGEQGFLNVIVHPAFAENRLLYFYYSANSTAEGTSVDKHRVVTMALGADGTLDPDSEQIIVRGLMGPANHNGGGLAILGDYLYIGTGDTGNNSGSPPGENISNYYPTCFTNAQGKLLRVHLDGAIPSDNPLLGLTVSQCGDGPGDEPYGTSTDARPEIFAWGFRNAFRVWGDPVTGSLWVGDVGEVSYEMIHRVPGTGALHFGWPFREGNLGLARETCENVEPNVGQCIDAQYACQHGSGGCNSITGGPILDDERWPEGMRGRYVFGDYSTQNVWTLPVDDSRSSVVGEREPLASISGAGPVSIVEHDGALYIVAYSGNGRVSRIAPPEPEPPDVDAGVGEVDASAPTDAGPGEPPVEDDDGSDDDFVDDAAVSDDDIAADDDIADDDSSDDDVSDDDVSALADGGPGPDDQLADASLGAADDDSTGEPTPDDDESDDGPNEASDDDSPDPSEPEPGGGEGPGSETDADVVSGDPSRGDSGTDAEEMAASAEEGGCDCRVVQTGSKESRAVGWIALLALVGVWRRRDRLARSPVRL